MLKLLSAAKAGLGITHSDHSLTSTHTAEIAC